MRIATDSPDLAAVAPFDEAVLKALMSATAKEPERNPAPVRQAALTALGAIADANPDLDVRANVVKRLQEALTEPGNVSTAATALGRCSRAAEEARDALTDLRVTSPSMEIRNAAAAALAQINRDTAITEHLDKVEMNETTVSARVYVTTFRLVKAADDDALAAAAERIAALPRTADALKAAAALTRLPDADKAKYANVRDSAPRTLAKWGTDKTRLRGWIAPELIKCTENAACTAPAFAALTPWGKAEGSLAEANTAKLAGLLNGRAAGRALDTLGKWGDAHAGVRAAGLAGVADHAKGNAATAGKALDVIARWGNVKPKVRAKALDDVAKPVKDKAATSAKALDVIAGWAGKHADFRPKAVPVLADFAGDGSNQKFVDALVRSDLDAVRFLKKRLANPNVKDKVQRDKAEKLLAALKPALIRRGKNPPIRHGASTHSPRPAR